MQSFLACPSDIVTASIGHPHLYKVHLVLQNRIDTSSSLHHHECSPSSCVASSLPILLYLAVYYSSKIYCDK